MKTIGGIAMIITGLWVLKCQFSGEQIVGFDAFLGPLLMIVGMLIIFS